LTLSKHSKARNYQTTLLLSSSSFKFLSTMVSRGFQPGFFIDYANTKTSPFQYFPYCFDYVPGMHATTVLPSQFHDLKVIERLAVVGYSGLLTVATTTMMYLACRPSATSTSSSLQTTSKDKHTHVVITVASAIFPFLLMIAPSYHHNQPGSNKKARRNKNERMEEEALCD
jgi:hypothetical protein